MQDTGVSDAARPRLSDGGDAAIPEQSRAERDTPAPEPSSGSIDFGRYYYEHHCGGAPYERSPLWLTFFDRLADQIVEQLDPTRVLDAGCAIGMLVEKLRERGVEAWGVDISEWAISQAHESVRPYLAVASLVDPLPAGLPEHYDLVTCIEVVEHMQPAESEAAIRRLGSLGDRIFFSSSPTDFAEPTHVNVQAQEHWSVLFARTGHFRNPDYVVGYPTPWTALYERASSDLGEVVRRYDRKLIQMGHELRDIRQTALNLQDRLTHLAATDAVLEHVKALEAELVVARRLLGSRSGRMLRAYHAARGKLRRRA